jgi:hypothetical protein
MEFAGSDDAWPERKGAALMARKLTEPTLWDAEFPKQRLQRAIELAKENRSDRDWRSAEIEVERAISDKFDNHRACALSRCRRARRCIGNPPLCWSKRITDHRIPAKVQDTIDRVYVAIQQEREAAAREGRAPRVLRPVAAHERRKR